MCGVSFENIRGSLFVCLFLFFTKGAVSRVWCTSTLKLHQSFKQSKHCHKWQNDLHWSKDSIWTPIYQYGIFLKIFAAVWVSQKWVQCVGKAAVLIRTLRDKNFQFLRMMYNWIFLTQFLECPLALYTKLQSMHMGFFSCMKFVEVSWNPWFNVSLWWISLLCYICYKAFQKSLKWLVIIVYIFLLCTEWIILGPGMQLCWYQPTHGAYTYT